jgi:hypothetical protein
MNDKVNSNILLSGGCPTSIVRRTTPRVMVIKPIMLNILAAP